MGYSICRYILGQDAPADAPERLALRLRSVVDRPVVLTAREMPDGPLEHHEWRAAREAGARVIDVDGAVPFAQLVTAGDDVLGPAAYLLRQSDDEGLDRTHPSRRRLRGLFRDKDLLWLIHSEEQPIPWNSRMLYVLPGNPASWGPEVPVMPSLLVPALPGTARPCPICRAEYVSQAERGQCPSCGFVAWPFPTADLARDTVRVPLDAFACGRCPRCQQAREFTHSIEQCFRCGQLLHGEAGRHALTLTENEAEIRRLLGAGSAA